LVDWWRSAGERRAGSIGTQYHSSGNTAVLHACVRSSCWEKQWLLEPQHTTWRIWCVSMSSCSSAFNPLLSPLAVFPASVFPLAFFWSSDKRSLFCQKLWVETCRWWQSSMPWLALAPTPHSATVSVYIA
jgi:hypothetical protein